MDRFGLVGVSHRRASSEELARFRSLTPSEGLLRRLREELGLAEILLLGTCNRLELLYHDPGRRPADEVLQAFARFLARETGARPEALAAPLFALNGEDAVKHLFGVLCGLESLVLGDIQIPGQFRRALVLAREAGTCGTFLGLLGDEALKVSKRVRAALDFGERPLSVAEIAVRALREHRRKAPGRLQVVLVGAGEMIQKTALRLGGWKAVDLLFVNRTEAAARALAAEHGGRALSLEAFRAGPPAFDALVAATAAPEALLGPEHLPPRPEDAPPALLLDLGMPPDVDPACGGLPGYHRRGVLDLGREAAGARREAELLARQARPLFRERLELLRRRLLQKDLAPAAGRLRDEAARRAREEAERWLQGRLAHLGEADREAVTALVERVVERSVQVPLAGLRELLQDLQREPAAAGLLRERLRESRPPDAA